MLLKQVGGKGQERLIAASTLATGAGLAVETAVAYLRAGGTPVEWSGSPSGFLIGSDRSEASASAGALLAADLPRLVLGSHAGAVVIAWSRCEACLAAFSAMAPIADRDAVLTGATAALVHQRNVLGFGEPDGWWVLRGLVFEPSTLLRCPEHR